MKLEENLPKKLQVYFNEYNVLMENTVYFPLVSGLLQSYAQTNPLIRERYQFMPFIFIRDYPGQILSQYQNPAIAAFSISMWNTSLSLEVARQVKRKFPECLIVFGGPNAPFCADDFFRSYPFVDVTVRGEGEQTFTDLLIRFLNTRDFKDISGISYRDPKSSRCVRNEERHLIENLDIIPSPYLAGNFDYLLDGDINFQTIIETNRGCPFMCSYCFWGQGGLNKRFRFYSLERIGKVIEWCGRNKIKYVFCADSNFGIFERDLKIASYFVETKNKYGFPEKFRVCYSKNAEDTVYQIGKLLTKYKLEKGITLSRQSNNLEALANIGRRNVKLSIYDNLQKKYNKDNVPIYTELILGLPGETYQSFKKGIEEILQAGLRNQLFVYNCQVYPNTELADKEYQERFGIVTKRIPLNEVHAAVRPQELVKEYEDIIVSTNSMPIEDWRRSTVFAWVMQVFHGLKLGFYILNYLSDRHNVKYTDFFEYVAQMKMPDGILRNEILSFYKVTDQILQEKERCRVLPDFGPIYWEQEEACYLNISNNKKGFYDEMHELVKEYLDSIGRDYDKEELREVIEYQEARVPDYKPLEKQEYYFKYNIPEYFAAYFSENQQKLIKRPQIMKLINPKDYNGDKETFAKEIILYGRKSGKMLYPVNY